MTNKWTYKKSWCARRRRVLVWRFIAPDLIAAVLWCSADRRGTQMVCSPAATANSWVSCQHGDIWNLWSGRESGGWFSGHGESRNSEKKHEQRKTCLIICLFINCQYITVRWSVWKLLLKHSKMLNSLKIMLLGPNSEQLQLIQTSNIKNYCIFKLNFIQAI